MQRVRIKICGVTTPEDARAAGEAGADAIGLNFYRESPRFLEHDKVLAVIRSIPVFTSVVGVFVDEPFREMFARALAYGLRAVQSNEKRPDSILEDALPIARIPSFRIKTAKNLDRVRKFVQACQEVGRAPAAVLLDSHAEGQMGGTGKVLPWELLRGFDLGVPLILAGGLTAENVAEAIEIVRPWGVDVASGVELAPGRKDPEKMARFVRAVHTAAARLPEDTF